LLTQKDMETLTSSESSYPRARPGEERRRNLADLLRATYDGRRLSWFRRVLGALLIITGAPAVVLIECGGSIFRRATVILALLWLFLVLPMVRLLCLEWRNTRLTERLRVLVYSDDHGG